MANHMIVTRPLPEEYPPDFEQYMKLVPGNDLLSYFENQKESVASVAQNLSEDQLLYRYAEGKWSIKAVFQHVIDCERIYTYRALCIARGDTTPLPGFEENDYALSAHADRRNVEQIIVEYKAVRAATVELFKSFDEEMLLCVGMANNAKRSVRSIGYSAAGHEIHHLNVIKERYVKNK